MIAQWTRKVFFKRVIAATLFSIIIFALLTLASYLSSKEGKYDFELGYPLRFYHQFTLDNKTVTNWGWTPRNFFIDVAVIWFVIVVNYFWWTRYDAVPAIRRIVIALGWAAFIIWCLMTLIVIIFLIDRWTHPNMKSISDRDLLTYARFSIWLLLIFIFSKLCMRLKFLQIGKQEY